MYSEGQKHEIMIVPDLVATDLFTTPNMIQSQTQSH